MDIKESIQSVGEILSDFLKEGPKSPDHTTKIKEQISKIVADIVIDPAESTENYKRICKDFLDNVIAVKGLPTRAILPEGENRSSIVSSSGSQVAKSSDSLLPEITERYNFCVENYRKQSKIYQDEQLKQFYELLSSFVSQVPIGGSKDKSIKSKMSNIKRELRSLVKWSQLFYAYKAASFPSEVEYLFALKGNPIAAVWRYNMLDEQGEYQKTYDHKGRDGSVYAVRGNWALEKGLMTVGPNGYIDETGRPKQEIGCMCWNEWLYGLRDLPDEMLTVKGKAELQRAGQAVAALLGETLPKASLDELKRLRPTTQTESQFQGSNISADHQTERAGLKAKLMSWLGRSGS